MTVKAGSSVKRLDPSRSHLSHDFAHFKNVQGAVSVDATRLGRHMDRHSLAVDYMSFVTTLRALTLVEGACARNVREFSSLAC
jgi:hypothetical protein